MRNVRSHRPNRGRSGTIRSALGDYGGVGGGGVAPAPPPPGVNYVTQANDPYVTEDGSSNYVTE